MCISECFSLHVDQSLTKTNKKKKISMNVCPECVLDCTGLEYANPLGCVCFWYSVTLVQHCTLVSFLNVLWSTASCRLVVGRSSQPSFNVTVSPSSQEKTVTPRRLLFGQTTLWSEEAIVRPQSVTSQCFTEPIYTSPTQAYTNRLCVLISLIVFLNMSILINAWRH